MATADSCYLITLKTRQFPKRAKDSATYWWPLLGIGSSSPAWHCNQTIIRQHDVTTIEVVRHLANGYVGRWYTPIKGDLFARQRGAKGGGTAIPTRWVEKYTHA